VGLPADQEVAQHHEGPPVPSTSSDAATGKDDRSSGVDDVDISSFYLRIKSDESSVFDAVLIFMTSPPHKGTN
jgi:hypothetical protein